MPELTLSEIAAVTGGRVEGDEGVRIRSVAPLESAGPDQLSFIANARYQGYLQATRAGAVLVSEDVAGRVPESLPRLVVPDAHLALYRILPRLHPRPRAEPGMHPTAVIDASAELADDVRVEAYAVIGAGSHVGPGARIGTHACVGEGVAIGAGTVVHPHVTLHDGVRIGERCVIHSGARIGREGFGFVWADGGHRKVPQVGGCILEDDVEVGANCTIDRGSVGDTVVGAGSKIDSLVHLGHNVRIGRDAILVAQVGVSGSTRVGDGVVLGGQAGVIGHASIGDGARVAARAGVIGDVPAGETYSGYPARPHREALRAQGLLFRLPELVRRLRALERSLRDHQQRST